MIATLLVVPMINVAADDATPWLIPTTFANTTELYTTDSNAITATQLPAGAVITIDGKADEAFWAATPSLEINAANKAANGNTYNDALDAKYYIMWDANALYILEKRTEATITLSKGANFWSNGDMTFYGICLPTAVTAEKTGTAPLIGTWVTDATVGATGDAYNYFRGQKYGWNAEANEANSAAGRARTYEKVAGIESKFSVVEGGYVIETKIEWSAVAYANADAFAPAVGTELGMDFIFTGDNFNKNFFPNRAGC
jgi:hypothetical protein